MTAFILTAFLTSAVADGVTSYQALQRGGRESNPVARHIGLTPFGVAAWTIGGSVALGGVAVTRKGPTKTALLWVLVGGSLLHGFAALHNRRVNLR